MEVRPNIIPDYAELETYIRAPTLQEVDTLTDKVVRCYEAAATATDCEVNVDKDELVIKDMLQNPMLASAFGRNLSELGMEFVDGSDQPPSGSTDMGNVSYEVP